MNEDEKNRKELLKIKNIENKNNQEEKKESSKSILFNDDNQTLNEVKKYLYKIYIFIYL